MDKPDCYYVNVNSLGQCDTVEENEIYLNIPRRGRVGMAQNSPEENVDEIEALNEACIDIPQTAASAQNSTGENEDETEESNEDNIDIRRRGALTRNSSQQNEQEIEASTDNYLYEYVTTPNRLRSHLRVTRYDFDANHDKRQKQWERNYSDAAIFLHEGKNNEKFNTHPRTRHKLRAYAFAHHLALEIVELIAALVLLLLVIVEPPPLTKIPVSVHSCLEILCLLILSIPLIVKLIWLGPTNYVRHISTMIRTVALILMLVEALVIIFRQTSHFRVMRVFRPIFITNSYHLRGVRRFLRQILQSARDAVEMMILMALFVFVFAIFGFYLFHDIPGNLYFSTLLNSYFSLLALITTVNFPDVMLPAYNYSKFSALFFMVYIIIVFYFLMNLLLAVIYGSFASKEKMKAKSLFIHRRQACLHAMKLLVSTQHDNAITLSKFQGLMRYYKPNFSRLEVYRLFKCLNTTATGLLTLDEFYNFFHYASMKWFDKQHEEKRLAPFWNNFHPYLKNIFFFIYYLVTRKWFFYTTQALIAINFIIFLGHAVSISNDDSLSHDADWYAIIFLTIFTLEAILKLLGLGPTRYFEDKWNIFDLILVLATYVGIIIEHTLKESFEFIIALRAVRLIKFLEIIGRFRAISANITPLLPHAFSAGLAIILINYSYAVLGMQLFADYDLSNCCGNTSVEGFYRSDIDINAMINTTTTNSTAVTGASVGYYLINFNEIASSMVLLFQLSINNYHIVMEGYAAASSEFSRLYFILFFITTTLFMSVVIAFIIDTFTFRINYHKLLRQQGKTHIRDTRVRCEIYLSQQELDMCNKKKRLEYIGSSRGGNDNPGFVGDTELRQRRPDTGGLQVDKGGVVYLGRRRRKKFDESLMMYSDEVPQWMEESLDETTVLEPAAGPRQSESGGENERRANVMLCDGLYFCRRTCDS